MKEIKILLVDDEEEFVSTLVERLGIRGIRAAGTTTGKEALEQLAHERFDVVVADLKMPLIDGREIKQTVERRYPTTRVVLMTGHGAEQAEGHDQGDYLLKPFSIDTLIDRIEDIGPQAEDGDDA